MQTGRPTKMDEITLQKIEGAFSNGATDEEACFVANISTSTLYNYQEKYPEFVERKEGLKNMIKYQAKSNIAEAIRRNNKTEDSKWYVERKIKKEFGNNVDITSDGEKVIPILGGITNKEKNGLHRDNSITQTTEAKEKD